MQYWKIYFKCVLISSISFLILGCFPKQNVQTETFLLHQPELKQNIIKSTNAKTVYLEQVQATTPFNSLHFIFKLKPTHYQLDYYHYFLNSPSNQLMTMFTTQLNNLRNVKLTTCRQDAKYLLNITLNKFYIDNTTNPKKAIIDLSIRLQSSTQTILWWHNYYSATPIENYAAGANNIVLAWNKGMQTILKDSINAITNKLAQQPNTK